MSNQIYIRNLLQLKHLSLRPAKKIADFSEIAISVTWIYRLQLRDTILFIRIRNLSLR